MKGARVSQYFLPISHYLGLSLINFKDTVFLLVCWQFLNWVSHSSKVNSFHSAALVVGMKMLLPQFDQLQETLGEVERVTTSHPLCVLLQVGKHLRV